MKVKANYSDGQTAESHAIEVDLKPEGIYLPSGTIWYYPDVKLLSSDKWAGRLSFENKFDKGPGLTLLFDRGKDDPAWDYLRRISSKLTGDNSWDFARWQVITAGAIIGLMFAFYLLYPYANRALVAVIPDSWAKLTFTGKVNFAQIEQAPEDVPVFGEGLAEAFDVG